MEEYTFEEIKEIVTGWSKKDILKCLSKVDEAVISKNNNDILILDFTFSKCMAQLTVKTPYFAPYRFVFFEAMTMDSQKAQDTGKPELVYFFGDSEGMSGDEVINKLEAAIKYCSEYVPD